MGHIRSEIEISRKYLSCWNKHNAAAIMAAQSMANQENLAEERPLELYDAMRGSYMTHDEQVAHITAVIGVNEWNRLVALKEILNPLQFDQLLCEAITETARPYNLVLKPVSCSMPADYSFDPLA